VGARAVVKARGREYASSALAKLAAAQRNLDKHVTSSGDGLCAACQTPGPCQQRQAAAEVFAEHDCLPRRIPGATRPDLIRSLRLRRINPNPASRLSG
jgi:hypothetical protein